MDIFIGLVAGAAVAAIIVYLVQEIRRRQEVARLEGQLERAQDTEALLETAKAELKTVFQASAGQALQANNEQFLTLAEQNFKVAKAELEKQKRHFEELVEPLSRDYARLNPNIALLMEANRAVAVETKGLKDALSDNRQVGVWGEIQLRRIIELANMVEYCDFSEQTTVDDGSGRPDVTVRLPDNRAIVIDSKASTAAYLEAQEAESETGAAEALKRHADALNSKVNDLSKKDYGSRVKGSLPFVVMFVPGDQFLAAALRARPSIVEDAIKQRVAIATPSTLISLLWAVANGWERQHLAENAERIREAGEEMHKRLLTFMKHYSDAGRQLGQAVQSFNSSINSFDSRLIPHVRRFAELRGQDSESYSAPPQIGEEPRSSRHVSADMLADPEDKNETP